MSLKPFSDRLILKLVKAEEKTAGGIILPEAAQNDNQQEAEVVAVGPGRQFDNGQIVPLTTQTGDRVIFARYAAVEIKHGGETLLVIQEKDLLAKVEWCTGLTTQASPWRCEV